MGHAVAEKPVRVARPATIHISVNAVSFSAAILGLPWRTGVAWSWPRPDIQMELIMINQDREFPPADREWMDWPTEVLQRALSVIAITQYEWALRGATDEPVANRARFAQPLISLAQDASPEP
jgi:hypothetical protein